MSPNQAHGVPDGCHLWQGGVTHIPPCPGWAQRPVNLGCPCVFPRVAQQFWDERGVTDCCFIKAKQEQ